MTQKEIIQKYNLMPHEENGRYAENHYPYNGTDRAGSGSTYFHIGPGETTAFHVIDCDEYWCYHSGSTLDIWIIDQNGKLEINKFGLEQDADPIVYFPKGVIFGSKSEDTHSEGTFFSCITVPRFDYKGFKLVDKEEVLRLCPKAEEFWK